MISVHNRCSASGDDGIGVVRQPPAKYRGDMVKADDKNAASGGVANHAHRLCWPQAL